MALIELQGSAPCPPYTLLTHVLSLTSVDVTSSKRRPYSTKHPSSIIPANTKTLHHLFPRTNNSGTYPPPLFSLSPHSSLTPTNLLLRIPPLPPLSVLLPKASSPNLHKSTHEPTTLPSPEASTATKNIASSTPIGNATTQFPRSIPTASADPWMALGALEAGTRCCTHGSP